MNVTGEKTTNIIFQGEGVSVRYCRCRNIVALQYKGISFFLWPREAWEFQENLGGLLQELSRRPAMIPEYRVRVRNGGDGLAQELTHSDVAELHGVLDVIRMNFEAESTVA